MSPALILVFAVALSSCAAPQSQHTVVVPPLRWESHVEFKNERQSDFVGWIGLRVGDRAIRLIEHPRSSCGLLDRSRYHWYSIPHTALTAAVGWYAGGGEQFYVTLEGSSLVVHHRTDEEVAPNPSWEILKTIPLPATTSNQALERTADRRENLLSMTSTLQPEAQLALVSGRSAYSR
jgi:hypothetical protein